MKSVNKSLNKWLEEFKTFEFPNYEEHPYLDLYMDQVLTYLERQLALFNYSSLDKQITSSRINNYVKDEVITRPNKKKYNREHLALLEEVYTLKQVLTISETKQIIQSSYNNAENADVFNKFKSYTKALNQKACDEAMQALSGIEDNNIKNLNDLALRMALVSNAYNQIAKRILFLTKLYEDNQEVEEEKSE